jgi:preprotein translocase subunit SecD
MKNSKLVKGLSILVIVAISLVSFAGILVKKQGQVANILPDYSLGMSLNGGRVAKFAVSDDEEEVIYDADGNVATDGEDEDGNLKEGYTKQTVAINSEDVLNEENYNKVKQVIENRLKNMAISEYVVKVNNNNGEIIVELPEDSDTDNTISYLTYIGKFEIKDSDTEEVLMNNDDLKEAYAAYGSTSSGTVVYLNIVFNKEGSKKLEDISNTYVESTDEDGNDTTKSISIELDGESMLTTYFDETITTGNIQLTIGSATSSSDTLTSYLEQAREVAGLIDSGVMPIEYELEENNYISPVINNTTLNVIMCVILVCVVITFVYWIAKFKTNGIFGVISTIGLVAITLLVIRYTNVVISIETIVSAIVILISNFIILQYALTKFEKGNENKKEIIKQTYKRYASILCPIYIIAIVFTFIDWLSVASIGMVLFWGMTVLAIYNYITMKLLFDVKEAKK